jgi:hypothetical protein
MPVSITKTTIMQLSTILEIDKTIRPKIDPDKLYFWFSVTGTHYKNPAVLCEKIEYEIHYNMPIGQNIVVVINTAGKEQRLLVKCVFCDAISNRFTFTHLVTGEKSIIAFYRIKEVYKILEVAENIDNY